MKAHGHSEVCVGELHKVTLGSVVFLYAGKYVELSGALRLSALEAFRNHQTLKVPCACCGTDIGTAVVAVEYRSTTGAANWFPIKPEDVFEWQEEE